MTITYRMNNTTPDLVQTVMLRKFFQMVFVGNNRKSLHIYTASVIGGRRGVDESEKHSNDFYSTQYVSQLNDLLGFRMKFDFVVRGNDNNDVLSIESKNLTSGDQGFLSQIEYIRQVWGEECDIVHNNQAELIKKLAIILPKSPSVSSGRGGDVAEAQEGKTCKDTTSAETAALAHEQLLFICDEKKKQEGEMCALALAGNFLHDDYHRPSDWKKGDKAPEGSEYASYCIQVPPKVTLVPGIELVNWVKTTISFRNQFHDSNLNFCIQKDARPQTKVQYIAPDFTWYFSPPVKAFINNESSSAEIKLLRDSRESVRECKYRDQLNADKSGCDLLKCTCPLQNLSLWDHTTERYLNVINPVANKTTVNFKQWINDEMISYRQKYRLAVKNIFTRNVTIDSLNEINIFLDTTDEHGRGNRQFVLGLFISFALAFGIDKTRLNDAAIYFPFPRILEADAWWLLLLTLLSLNLLIRPPKAEKKQSYNIWRFFNVLGTFIWAIAVFIILKSPSLKPILPLSPVPIVLAFQSIYVFLVASDFLYICRNIQKYHDPILSSLFNDDIL